MKNSQYSEAQKVAISVFSFITMTWIYVVYVSVTSVNNYEFKPLKRCNLLKNIAQNEDEMLKSNSTQIFFIESHLERERSLKNARQACSIEAAARMNPDTPVYFLYATNDSEVTLNQSKWTNVLESYPNIKLRYFNIYEFSKGTPLEGFMRSDKWKGTMYLLEHMSDLLRSLVLYKYGGLYLDLDVLMLTPLRYLNYRNFLCVEITDNLASCIYRVNIEEGRRYTEEILKSLSDNFILDFWSANGPDRLTYVAHQICPNTVFSAENVTKCDFLDILPTSNCFPLGYDDFEQFYLDTNAKEIIEKVNDKNVYFVHIWNKMVEFREKDFKIELTSWAPYLQMAKLYCPRTHDKLDEFF